MLYMQPADYQQVRSRTHRAEQNLKHYRENLLRSVPPRAAAHAEALLQHREPGASQLRSGAQHLLGGVFELDWTCWSGHPLSSVTG